MDERRITACIDGSIHSQAACDAAIWAADRLGGPLTLLHTIERPVQAPMADTSGQIGFGAREQLLVELAELDVRRAQLEQQKGREMLNAAGRRATAAGLAEPALRQRNGRLADALQAIEADIRLLTLGKRGESSSAQDPVGANLEAVIRRVSCPVLVTGERFTPPERVLFAFDGSATGQRMIERAVASGLLGAFETHLVYVGQPDEARRTELDSAARTLGDAGAVLVTAMLDGEVEHALHDYQRTHAIQLMVMGAYGHGRIRRLLVGSTTTDMLARAEVPLLIVR